VWSFVVLFLSCRVLCCCCVVLVVSCVVLFLLCVCVCDLFLCLQVRQWANEGMAIHSCVAVHRCASGRGKHTVFTAMLLFTGAPVGERGGGHSQLFSCSQVRQWANEGVAIHSCFPVHRCASGRARGWPFTAVFLFTGAPVGERGGGHVEPSAREGQY